MGFTTYLAASITFPSLQIVSFGFKSEINVRYITARPHLQLACMGAVNVVWMGVVYCPWGDHGETESNKKSGAGPWTRSTFISYLPDNFLRGRGY